MSVKTKVEVTCDVCLSEMNQINQHEKTNISVIQTTEQTEGRNCTPYLQLRQLDICHQCEAKILDGNMLFSAGAMGYNKYSFKESP